MHETTVKEVNQVFIDQGTFKEVCLIQIVRESI